MKTSLKATLIAAAIASLPFGVHAAGLGQINILSGLGQPLQAEIVLNASAHELQSLTARIPSPETFRQANVPYSAAMAALRVSVENRGTRSVVKISSDRPVNEPFVDMLVELNWAAGRLIREYTVLLDPVDVRSGSAATAAPAAAAPVAAPASAPARAPAPASAQTADSYTVKRGDTLRQIAETHRPVEASLDQMLVALFRDNREAFDGNNMNRLRAGTVLSIPDAASAAAVGDAEARKEILAQAADFNAYRRRLAATVADRAAGEAEASSQVSGGRIEPKVTDAVPAQGQGDQVRVSRTDDGAGAAVQNARLQSLEEELVARDQALAEANDRVATLERNIRELQQLIELKNQNLAQVQQQAGSAAVPALAADKPAETVTVAAEQPAAAAQGAEAKSPTEPVAPEVAAPAEPEPQPQPKPRAKPVVAPEPEPEPDFLQALVQDPTVLGGAGGILLLLLGYAGYKARERRKAQAAADHSLGALSQLPPETNSVFGATGGQSVDTTNSSVIHTDFSQSGLSAIDADEGVDPVAEADVYMAYGRDAQAEEILLDALKVDPTRVAIHLKLLEIYAQRKNAKQFETIATELYARTSGRGTDWDKAAVMGRKLDPENPLYQGAAEPTEPATEPPRELATFAAAGVAAGAAVAETNAARADELAVAPLADLDFGATAAGESQLKDTWAMPRAAEGADGAAPTPEPLPGIDSTALDFDLDLDVTTNIAGDAVTLDLDDVPAPAAPAADAPGADGGELMLDLDLDQGGGAPTTAEAPLTEAELEDLQPLTATAVGGDLPPAEDKALDLDLDLSAAEPNGETSSASFDLAATLIGPDALLTEESPASQEDNGGFDSNLLDFDLDLDGAAPATAGTPAPATDLSSIDIDLEPFSSGSDGDSATAVMEAPARAAAASSVSAEASEEVDTKLELARAYEEMGDKEGARELLEEVLQEGNAEQQRAARSLMQRLA